MNEDYTKFINSYDNENTRKSIKFFIELLEKHNIELSSNVITDNDQLENVFVKCNIQGFNSVIGFRSVLKNYSIFIKDKTLFNLITKLDIYHVLKTLKANIQHSYLSESEFEAIYDEIGKYNNDEDTFFHNRLYYKTLFLSIYEGIYCDDMSVIKNLRVSDINGTAITLHYDSRTEKHINISDRLAKDLITLANDIDPKKKVSVWYRNNRNGLCKIPTQGLFYDSIFKVEIRSANSKYSYRSSYYGRLRRIAEEYIGHLIAPKNIYFSGIINRVKKRYGKSDKDFIKALEASDKTLIKIYEDEAKRSNYGVAFWNFRQTIMGRV